MLKNTSLPFFPLLRTGVLSAMLGLGAFCALDSMPAAAAQSTAVAVQESGSSLIAPGADIGMWVWRGEPVFEAQARQELIDFCKKYGITRLFVQVRFDPVGDGYRLRDPQAWSALLGLATKAGIRVEALDGAGDMGFAQNRADTLKRLDAVLAFQKSQPQSARFSAVHYDIEPYVTERWKSGDRQTVALELLETLQQIYAKTKAADPSLRVINDIPFWYSGREELKVPFNGEAKYLDEHVQDLSDSVGIMSYRTKMLGSNSTAEISKEELAYAQKIGRPLYLSLETISLSEAPQISFHGRGGEALIAAVRELHEGMKHHPGFGGINLHTYRAVRPMLEEAGKATDAVGAARSH